MRYFSSLLIILILSACGADGSDDFNVGGDSQPLEDTIGVGEDIVGQSDTAPEIEQLDPFDPILAEWSSPPSARAASEE